MTPTTQMDQFIQYWIDNHQESKQNEIIKKNLWNRPIMKQLQQQHWHHTRVENWVH